MKTFRKLRADEIEVRVNEINDKRLTLLLYKDARCDMRLLDEVIGAENWQCRYEEHKGTLFCYVGIHLDSGEWIWKSDAGAPSNMESQKGEASDAFKRACVRWGIGRELYTSPDIVVYAGNYTAKEYKDKNGQTKWRTFDRFRVDTIEYDADGKITAFAIVNAKTKKKIFEYGRSVARSATETENTHNYALEPVEARDEAHTQPEGAIGDVHWAALQKACADAGISGAELWSRYQITSKSQVTMGIFKDMMNYLEAK